MKPSSDVKREPLFLRVSTFITYGLLIAAPLGYLSEWLQWGTLTTFFFFAVAIIPLSGITSRLSDALVTHTTKDGETTKPRWGGIVGALLDNLSFIIVGIVALSQGLVNVVQASIAGAIISNTLLVLGLSFFFGTWVGRQPQMFDGERAKDYAKLLAVIVTAFVLLAFVEAADPTQTNIATGMSVASAVALLLLFLVYVAHEFFHWNRFEQLKHRIEQRFGQEEPLVHGVNTLLSSQGVHYRLKGPDNSTGESDLAAQANRVLAEQAPGYTLVAVAEAEEEPVPSPLPWPLALVGLVIVAVVTVFVSTEWATVTTQITTGKAPIAIGGVTLGFLKLSQTFLGLVIIPIIGSSAEHLNSIRGAIQGKTEAAVNNTAGSAIQITLLAAPVLVLVSTLIFPGHSFSFEFSGIELAVFGAATFIFYAVTEDGEGSWLEGAALIVVYAVFAVATWFLP